MLFAFRVPSVAVRITSSVLPSDWMTDDRDADQLVSLRDPDAELVADGRFIVPVVRGDELACCFEVDGHDP